MIATIIAAIVVIALISALVCAIMATDARDRRKMGTIGTQDPRPNGGFAQRGPRDTVSSLYQRLKDRQETIDALKAVLARINTHGQATAAYDERQKFRAMRIQRNEWRKLALRLGKAMERMQVQ